MRRSLPGLVLLFSACTSVPAPRPAPRAVLEAHAGVIHALAFSPDGALFASAGGGANPAVDEITLWRTESGERRMTFANYKAVASALAFSPDGKLLAVGSTDGRIVLLEIDSGAERIAFAGRAGAVLCLSFSFDGQALVSVVHADGEKGDVEVCRWDVLRGVPRETVATHAREPLALSPDGGTLAWSVESGIAVLDLDSKAEKVLSRIAVSRDGSLVFSPDGKWIAAVHREEWNPFPNKCPYVYLVDSKTGRIALRSPRPFDARRGLALSHDAKLLARGVHDGLQLWDLKTLEVRANVSEPSARTEGAELLAFSPDDRTLVSSDGRGLLVLWDVPRLVAVPSASGP